MRIKHDNPEFENPMAPERALELFNQSTGIGVRMVELAPIRRALGGLEGLVDGEREPTDEEIEKGIWGYPRYPTRAYDIQMALSKYMREKGQVPSSVRDYQGLVGAKKHMERACDSVRAARKALAEVISEAEAEGEPAGEYLTSAIVETLRLHRLTARAVEGIEGKLEILDWLHGTNAAGGQPRHAQALQHLVRRLFTVRKGDGVGPARASRLWKNPDNPDEIVPTQAIVNRSQADVEDTMFERGAAMAAGEDPGPGASDPATQSWADRQAYEQHSLGMRAAKRHRQGAWLSSREVALLLIAGGIDNLAPKTLTRRVEGYWGEVRKGLDGGQPDAD